MKLHLIRHELPRMSPAWLVGYSERTDEIRKALELLHERTGHTNVLLDITLNSRECLPGIPEGIVTGEAQRLWPLGMHFSIEHDGFEGSVIGHYTRLDGRRGVVGQQAGTHIVHVYGEKWLKP